MTRFFFFFNIYATMLLVVGETAMEKTQSLPLLSTIAILWFNCDISEITNSSLLP